MVKLRLDHGLLWLCRYAGNDGNSNGNGTADVDTDNDDDCSLLLLSTTTTVLIRLGLMQEEVGDKGDDDDDDHDRDQHHDASLFSLPLLLLMMKKKNLKLLDSSNTNNNAAAAADDDDDNDHNNLLLLSDLLIIALDDVRDMRHRADDKRTIALDAVQDAIDDEEEKNKKNKEKKKKDDNDGNTNNNNNEQQRRSRSNYQIENIERQRDKLMHRIRMKKQQEVEELELEKEHKGTTTNTSSTNYEKEWIRLIRTYNSVRILLHILSNPKTMMTKTNTTKPKQDHPQVSQNQRRGNKGKGKRALSTPLLVNEGVLKQCIHKVTESMMCLTASASVSSVAVAASNNDTIIINGADTCNSIEVVDKNTSLSVQSLLMNSNKTKKMWFQHIMDVVVVSNDEQNDTDADVDANVNDNASYNADDITSSNNKDITTTTTTIICLTDDDDDSDSDDESDNDSDSSHDKKKKIGENKNTNKKSDGTDCNDGDDEMMNSDGTAGGDIRDGGDAEDDTVDLPHKKLCSVWNRLLDQHMNNLILVTTTNKNTMDSNEDKDDDNTNGIPSSLTQVFSTLDIHGTTISPDDSRRTDSEFDTINSDTTTANASRNIIISTKARGKQLDAKFSLVVSNKTTKIDNAYKRSIDRLHFKLEDVIRRGPKQYRDARLEVYGSCLSGLSLGKNADVDLSLTFRHAYDCRHRCMVLGTTGPKKYLRSVTECIYNISRRLEVRDNDFIRIEAIPRARVPVIRGLYKNAQNPYNDDGSIHFDICLLNDIAVANSGLIKEYSDVDIRVKSLMIAIKKWTKHHEIHSAQDNYLSSYTWMNLVIFYLQCIGFVPNLQCPKLMEEVKEFHYDPQNNPKHNVNELNTAYLKWNGQVDKYWTRSQHVDETYGSSITAMLYGFFHFYSHQFPYQLYMISIKRGPDTLLPKTMFMNNHQSTSMFFCIEDPFETYDSHFPHDLASPTDEKSSLFIYRCLYESEHHFRKLLSVVGPSELSSSSPNGNSKEIDASTDQLWPDVKNTDDEHGFNEGRRRRTKRRPECTLLIRNLPIPTAITKKVDDDNDADEKDSNSDEYVAATEQDLVRIFQPFSERNRSTLISLNLSRFDHKLAYVDYDSAEPVVAILARHSKKPFTYNGHTLDIVQKSNQHTKNKNNSNKKPRPQGKKRRKQKSQIQTTAASSSAPPPNSDPHAAEKSNKNGNSNKKDRKNNNNDTSKRNDVQKAAVTKSNRSRLSNRNKTKFDATTSDGNTTTKNDNNNKNKGNNNGAQTKNGNDDSKQKPVKRRANTRSTKKKENKTKQHEQKVEKATKSKSTHQA